MFSIDLTNEDGVDKYNLVNRSSGEYITVVPEFGGNLNEVCFKKNETLNRIVSGYKTREEFQKHEGFKGSKLVPFVNRVQDGKYFFEENEHQLPINETELNNAHHGLFFDRSFDVIKKETSCDHALLEMMTNYLAEVHGYPFTFECVVSYLFSESTGLKIETKIKNNGNEKMPVADGWHPYFEFDCDVSELFLQLPCGEKNIMDEQLIPTGQKLQFQDYKILKQIGDSEIDTGISLNPEGGKAVTRIYCEANDISVEVWQETGDKKYNYLQVYIPPSRRSIAIEPMTSNTNAFNNNDGLIVLDPGEEFVTAFGIRLT